MEVLKRKGSRQNMRQYVLIFSAVILIIIISMGAYLLHFYYEQMKEDFYKSNLQYVESIARAHENEYQILKDIATQIEISDAAKFDLKEQPEKSRDLKEQLYRYKSVNQFFDVMYCFYQKGEYLYNHSTSISIDLFSRKAYTFENYSPDEIRGIITDKITTTKVLPESGMDGEMLYFYVNRGDAAVYILPVPPSYDTVLIFFIGGDHFDSLLFDEENAARNTYLIYDGEVVAQRGQCEIDKDELKEQLAGADGQKRVTLGKTSYVLTKESSENGFSYAAVQKMSVFTDNLKSHSWGIAILLILCCIPTIILVGSVSGKMLGEVRTINRMLSDESDDIYSLGSIESGVQRLVSSSQSMKEDQLSLRKNRFVRNFLQSEYSAMEVLRRDAAAAEINAALGMYMIGVMGSRSSGNEKKAFEQILAYVEGKEGIDGYGIHLMNTNQSVMVLFGSSETGLYDAYQEILDLGKKYCEEFIVAVSWYHRSLLIGSNAYLEANTAYDSRFLMDNSRIIRFRELDREADSINSYQDLRKRYMVQLENTIRVGSEEEVESAIRDLCRKLEKEQAPLLTFRLLYDEVLRFIMTQWGGEDKDWNEIYNVFTLSRCLTLEDFTSLLTEACHMILDRDANAENKQSELVANAVRKMKESYSDAELNMASLADALGISPVTLAVEFKNGTGISPSDYLAVIRLDHARELLATSDMLVKDISTAVGYEDDHVFIRRFKKYTGKTPGQYRKDVREAEDGNKTV